MQTYLNREGKPIIRRCENCAHYKPMPNAVKMGYCHKRPLLFAFTGEHTVYAITRDFYNCDIQELPNEQYLKENATSVEMDFTLLKQGN